MSAVVKSRGDLNGEATEFPFGANQVTEQTPSAPDPFDPTSLRINGDTLAAIGVKKLLTTVPVRKPDKSWFVRVHPDPSFRLETLVIELKEDRESFLIAPHLRCELATETTVKPVALFTAVNRQGNLFLWPVNLPMPDGRQNEWNRSAAEAAAKAQQSWVRVAANMSLGAYELYAANGELPDPEWPEHSFRDLIAIAFKDKLIDSLDHPVLQRLRGEL